MKCTKCMTGECISSYITQCEACLKKRQEELQKEIHEISKILTSFFPPAYHYTND